MSLVGRALALGVHPIARAADPGQAGLPIADLEAAVVAAGIEIGGVRKRQVLGTAVNNSQDLFEWVEGGRWRWIEPRQPQGAGLSGRALAEEAYQLAVKHDPDRRGIDYNEMTKLLQSVGVIIRGTNAGRTVYSAMNGATDWFEWIGRSTFRWKV